jgi:RNA polymerase sigma factor (sigma-70 family)
VAVSPASRPAAPSPVGANVAIESLYTEHVGRVYRYCLRFLRDPTEAEDAAQTTFIYALRALRKGVRPEFEAAWLLAIARNVCLSRKEASERRRDFEVPRDVHVLQETVAAAAGDRLQDEMIRLEQALGDLPDVQRRVIVLREWQGLSYREIATALDLSVAAVETHIFRARRALAERLADEAPERKRRTLARLNAGSILVWLKSPFATGGALKAAAAVAAVAGGVALGAQVLEPLPPQAPPRDGIVRPRAEAYVLPQAAELDAVRIAPRKRPDVPSAGRPPAVEPAPPEAAPEPAEPPSLVLDVVETTVSDTARALDEQVDLSGVLAGLPPLRLETPDLQSGLLP